jgi:hypothetical protein
MSFAHVIEATPQRFINKLLQADPTLAAQPLERRGDIII